MRQGKRKSPELQTYAPPFPVSKHMRLQFLLAARLVPSGISSKSTPSPSPSPTPLPLSSPIPFLPLPSLPPRLPTPTISLTNYEGTPPPLIRSTVFRASCTLSQPSLHTAFPTTFTTPLPFPYVVNIITRPPPPAGWGCTAPSPPAPAARAPPGWLPRWGTAPGRAGRGPGPPDGGRPPAANSRPDPAAAETERVGG